MTFEQLHKSLQNKNLGNENYDDVSSQKVYDQLDCLLNPKNHPAIWDENNFSNISDLNDKVSLSKDSIDVLNAVKDRKTLIYAMIAPAFLGQFSDSVTPGKLRSALKYLGFSGMIEVSLFADILTLKEALEFNEKVNDDSDFMLTSCCCPMWIALLRKNNLLSHVPGSVSPMIAAGRSIKIIHPEAITVFIGPCLAKKTEMNEKDLVEAVDYVLTFQEMANIFDALDINPENMPESNSDHSSKAGRIYAHTGGVSLAVLETVKRLNPNKKIIAKQANGIVECKKLMEEFTKDKRDANFYEGMGCIGGCVGGPKKIIDKEIGKENVDHYADSAVYPTPIDNPYVIKLLSMLGFDTVESLLADSKIFTRHFE